MNAKREAHIAALPDSPYMTVTELAARYKLSASSIRKIPRDVLPFSVFCGGALQRRRYHIDDVMVYESNRRAA